VRVQTTNITTDAPRAHPARSLARHPEIIDEPT